VSQYYGGKVSVNRPQALGFFVLVWLYCNAKMDSFEECSRDPGALAGSRPPLRCGVAGQDAGFRLKAVVVENVGRSFSSAAEDEAGSRQS